MGQNNGEMMDYHGLAAGPNTETDCVTSNDNKPSTNGKLCVILTLLFCTTVFSLISMIFIIVAYFKVINADLTIDSVTLIPSVSSWIKSTTNSASMTTLLTRGAAISSALAQIDWTIEIKQECVGFDTCAWDGNVVECYDFNKNSTFCEEGIPPTNMGIFDPQATCYWDYDNGYGSCSGNAKYCQVDAYKAETACSPEDTATDPTTNSNRQNAFTQLAARMNEAASQNTDSRTDESPSSSFDIVGYLANELSEDWGAIGLRLADNLESASKFDWESIAETFSGEVDAEKDAANIKMGILFYKDWVEKISKPLVGV